MTRSALLSSARPGETAATEATTATAPLVLVAHGSRDLRSARTMRQLARTVAAGWQASVTAAFLDFNLPKVPAVVRGLAGERPIVVPALLTCAYHGRVDLPAVLASTDVDLQLTPVLGPAAPGEQPHPLLLAALRRRLDECDVDHDGLVLIAAGTSYAPARSAVELVARMLAGDLPVAVGYASGSGPRAADAVAAVRAAGATRVAVASYFLAPGLLYDAAVASAYAGGAVAVAAPLGPAPEITALVLERARTVHSSHSRIDVA